MKRMRPLEGLKVLISTSTFGVHDRRPLDRLKETGCEVIENPYKRRLTKEEAIELLSNEISGLIAGLEPLDKEVLEKTNLKVISRCGSGISNVDIAAAKELGIKVCSTPSGPTTAVAEITLGAMISLLRMLSLMDRNMHEGKWTKKTGAQLEGKTVVIIGFGRIGRKVAALLESFNVRLIAVDPNIHEKMDGVEILPIDKALPQADIITIHSSGEEQIISDNEFELVKNGTYILNAARGGVINEASLVNALETGKIAGAWLDTFSIEPYTGRLNKYPQVILTPHIGSYTLECRKSMEMEAVNNLISAFRESSDNA